MKVQWLGHSCIEIIGQNHILIDPDCLRQPLPDNAAEIQAGAVLAAKDVCEIDRGQGVPMRRLFAVEPGDVVDNVRMLVGYSSVGWLSELWARVWGRRHEFPGGTPFSFLVEDDPSTGLRRAFGVSAQTSVSPWSFGSGTKGSVEPLRAPLEPPVRRGRSQGSPGSELMSLHLDCKLTK